MKAVCLMYTQDARFLMLLNPQGEWEFPEADAGFASCAREISAHITDIGYHAIARICFNRFLPHSVALFTCCVDEFSPTHDTRCHGWFRVMPKQLPAYLQINFASIQAVMTSLREIT